MSIRCLSEHKADGDRDEVLAGGRGGGDVVVANLGEGADPSTQEWEAEPEAAGVAQAVGFRGSGCGASKGEPSRTAEKVGFDVAHVEWNDDVGGGGIDVCIRASGATDRSAAEGVVGVVEPQPYGEITESS